MKKKSLKGVHKLVSAVKQWSFKALGNFKEINCMNECLLIDRVFIFVESK